MQLLVQGCTVLSNWWYTLVSRGGGSVHNHLPHTFYTTHRERERGREEESEENSKHKSSYYSISWSVFLLRLAGLYPVGLSALSCSRFADSKGTTFSFILFHFLLHRAVVEVPLTITEMVRCS